MFIINLTHTAMQINIDTHTYDLTLKYMTGLILLGLIYV